MKTALRVGILVAAALAIVAAFAANGGDPEPAPPAERAVAPERPDPPQPDGAVVRQAALPDGVGDELDPEGLQNGTGTLRVLGLHVDDAIPAARMNLMLAGPGKFAARADEVGLAVFSVIPADDYLLDNDRGDRAIEVTIHPGRTTTVHFPVGRGVRVSGRVIDAAGRGIPGAVIRLLSGRPNRPFDIDWTASDGSFRVLDLPVNCQISARAPGYCAVPRVQLSKLEPGEEVEFVMNLGAGSITGFVTALGGSPIANAKMFIHANRELDPDLTVHTDDMGRFEVAGVRPGEHQWVASADGYEIAQGTCTVADGLPTRLDPALIPAPPGETPPGFPGFGSSRRPRGR